MFDIWSTVSQLGQPCLYRPITDRLLGADGLVRRDILTSIDRFFCEQLAAGRTSFEARRVPAILRSGDRYLNTSAMQKAIRRGDVELAMLCAQRSCLDDPSYTFRRLATCAVEDVGIGNLIAVAMALAILGNKQLREGEDTEELAAYIAYLLACSPKSRLACDLLSVADYDPTLSLRRTDLSRRPEAQLQSIALDRTATVAERMIAAWLLAGTARFRGANMPTVKRDRTSFVKLISKVRAPLLLYYLADRTGARLSDAMSVSWFLIGEIIDEDPPMNITRVDLPRTETIGEFPAYAYDLHTGTGRAALNRFCRTCRPVADALAMLPLQRRDIAASFAVFLEEGGMLRERLSCRAAEEIERCAHWAELAHAGVKSATQQNALREVTRASLHALNTIRSAMLVPIR